MEQKRSRSLVKPFLVFCLSFGIQAVYCNPTRRVCLEYDKFSINNLKNNETTTTTKCAMSQNMCFMLWKREILNGQIHTVVLKQGCWNYENNEKEACSGNKCLSYGLYDRANSAEFCCCQSDLCNKEIKLVNMPTTMTEKIYPTSSPDQQDTAQENHPVFIGIISAAAILILLVTSGIFAMVFWKRKKMQKEVAAHTNDGSLPPPNQLQHTNFNRPICKGTFGEIWQGTLNSKIVAIKKFHSSQKSSWEHEKEIYSLGLEHPGILKIFGASTYLEKDGSFGYIIVVEYHPKGSLRQFLISTTISWEVMCKIIHTIAEALAYLHGEIGEKNRKHPCIAHRDITSANILIKEDGQSCVLCDFGLSCIVTDKQRGEINKERNKVGSLRYMAPEALEGHINLNDVVSQLKQIDIYALGIVLWEISSRCRDICGGYEAPDYHLPFEEVGSHLTVQNLINFVLTRKKRPSFPNTWNANEQNVKSLQELIRECWDQDAEARLSALCVCQRIIRLKHYKF